MKKLITALVLSTSISAIASPLGCLMDYFTAHGVPRKSAIDGQPHPLNNLKDIQGFRLLETLGYSSWGIYGYSIYAYNQDMGYVQDSKNDPYHALQHCGCTIFMYHLSGNLIQNVSGLCGTH